MAAPARTGWTARFGDVSVVGDDRPDSPLLDSFFAGYDRAFVLPDEKEPLDGFRACLALNEQIFPFAPGPAREVILLAQDGEDGERVGGGNFLATLIGERIAVALNYLYVESDHRGRGLLRILLDATGVAARAYLDAPEAQVTLFIEQNDPLRMSAEDYATDSRHSGLDQIDRLRIWGKAGARLVDMDYVQPALSAGQDDDHGLAYAVLRHGGEQMEGAFLAAHLTSFFGISVLKGRDPRTVGTSAAQIAAAEAREQVPLLPLLPAADHLRETGLEGVEGGLVALARSLAG